MPEHKLRAAGVRQLIRGGVATLLLPTLLFIAAGKLDLPRAWLYAGTTAGTFIAMAVFLAIANPETINQRGMRKEGTKGWDRVLLAAVAILMFLVPIVAGLDIGRFHWSALGVEFAYAGIVLFLLGQMLVSWAMATNVHFEPTVRIQTDRNHEVVKTGPYRFIRHPGYLAINLSVVAVPAIIGSGAAMIPAGAVVVLFLVRTVLEDRTLLRELPGYSEYAREVRYRLLPFVW